LFNDYNYNKSWESPGSKNNDDVMTVGEWITVLIVFAIPIINIVMYFIWGFGGNANKNLQNFCRATLIIAAVGIVFGLLFAGCSRI